MEHLIKKHKMSECIRFCVRLQSLFVFFTVFTLSVIWFILSHCLFSSLKNMTFFRVKCEKGDFVDYFVHKYCLQFTMRIGNINQMSCVCGMAFLCGSTLVKLLLLQVGTVMIWPQMFKSKVKPKQTNKKTSENLNTINSFVSNTRYWP